MSATLDNSPKKTRQYRRSRDWKFAGKTPSGRDQEAHRLYSEGMKQEDIAKELNCSQPTVSRGIWRTQKWIAANWPHEPGKLTESEACRVSLVEHGIFLRHQQQRALREFEASCQPWRMVKTKTKKYPEGRKADGKEVTETHTEEYLQVPQRRAAFLREARQAAHELTTLNCGYLGSGSAISIDEPLEKEERLKWKGQIEWRDKRMAHLEKRLEQAERQVAELREVVRQAQQELALREEQATGSQAPPGNPIPRGSASASSEAEPRGSAFPGGAWERGVGGAYESATMQPDMREYAQYNKNITAKTDVTCNDYSRESRPVSTAAQNPHKNPSDRGGWRSREEIVDPSAPVQQRLTDRDENPPPRRWATKQYLEAIEYHCRKHGLKDRDPYKMWGIPDPRNMSPLMWMQKGLPYMLQTNHEPPKQ